MKSDNSFCIKLTDHLFDNFIQNTCEYFTALESDLKKINPYEAVDVILALSSFREYFNSEAEWERIALYNLDIIRKGISRSLYDKIATFSGMTHIAFVIHDLSVKTPNIEPFFQGINEILLENIAWYLEASDKKDFYTAGNFEVIKGLSGPLRYLLSMNNNAQMLNIAGKIIDVLIRRSDDVNLFNYVIPGWHYYPSEIEKSYMTVEAKKGCINYGMSHGMGGPLVTLSIAYKNGIHKAGLVDAINRLVSEYMKAAYYVNDIVYWPGRISFEQYVGLEEISNAPSQMSWCYGSVGILRALYMSGIIMSNNNVIQFALDELIKIAKMNLSDFLLSQPIVCHGYVGTAAIMTLMYFETGKSEFLQKTIELIEISITFNIERYYENEKKIAYERSIPLRADIHNHLEGYIGIIHTILSIIKGKVSETEKRFLIV